MIIFFVIHGSHGNRGHGYFEDSERKLMYERCPVCVDQNYLKKDELPKGYWTMSKSGIEFRTSKPSEENIVEFKREGVDIDCEWHWQIKGDSYTEDAIKFKCPNHDYQYLPIQELLN